MARRKALPPAFVDSRILTIRGEKVMLDADLAVVYGVATKALNQAVKRNGERFPSDFRFQLTKAERDEVVTNCDHLRSLRFSPVRPWAFTEHGAIMAASVLVNIEIMRAFVRLRQMLASNAALTKKLDELETKYDAQFNVVFQAIRELMTPPTASRKRIGFWPEKS